MVASFWCQSLKPNLLDSSIILKFKRQGFYYAFEKNVPCDINDIFWLDERQIPFSYNSDKFC